MMHPRTNASRALLFGLLLGVFSLQGCDRGADSGATANPVAPGRPGTGNPTVVVSPQPGSINESPGTGGSRGLIPEGVTGDPVSGANRAQRPGVGLDGGLSDGTGQDPSRGSAADAQPPAMGASANAR